MALSRKATGVRKDGIGFLTYDMQPFTEDCLYRISQALPHLQLRAYPVFTHPHQSNSRVNVVPSAIKGRFLGVNVSGSTQEGLASNVNWQAAWRCVRENRICVLLGLQGGTALLVALLGSVSGRTIVSVNQTLPLVWEARRRWWVRWLKRWLLSRCQIHIFQTLVSKEVLTTIYKISESQLVYAPFEVGASIFRHIVKKVARHEGKTRARYGIDREATLFIFVGNLHPFKGVVDLLKAVSIVAKKVPLFCLFVGPEEPRNKEGATIPHYQELAEQLRCTQYVKFIGAKPILELAQIYVDGDVMVLPTYKDCFPKVLVEAAIVGKPLLTT